MFRLRLQAPAMITLAAALVLLLPALLLGPWLPLVDLVAFVGLNAYPPELSAGPLHYGIFQFTYVGHYAVSRLLCDLRVPVPAQVLLFYFVQAGVSFWVIWRSLPRLVSDPWLRAVGLALGTLAFWDGLFLWGGPLPYSLAASSLALATFLAFWETEGPERRCGTEIAVLAGFSLCCHPFALPFALVLCGVRMVFVRQARWQSAALAAGLVVFGWVIAHDSPPAERGTAEQLGALFAVNPSEMASRIVDLFTQDAACLDYLFGPRPAWASVYFVVLGALHLTGFLLAPYLAITVRDRRWLRMLMVLNSIVAVLYLLSRDSPLASIPRWPQRILTFYAPFTFLAGFAGLVEVASRFFRRAETGEEKPSWGRWLVPVAVLAGLVPLQVSVFSLGRGIARNLEKVRAEFLRSPVAKAYVVVSGVDAIEPFYLRCVPYLLFSDRELIARNVLLFTEWHVQDRHPTRLTESWFDLGRKRFRAEFSSANGVLSVQLVEQPGDRFPVPEHTNRLGGGSAAVMATKQFAQGVELYQHGALRDALEHFNTAVQLDGNFAEAQNNLGYTLELSGRPAEALEHLAAAVKAKPAYFDARLNLANGLMKAGRSAEAVPHLQEALRLKPESTTARELLERALAPVPVKPQ